jgi:hypothetical protein
MKRRIIALGLFLTFGLLSGCEWLHHGLRNKSNEPPLETSDESKSSDDESVAPKGIHRSTRLPGALSSEGAEIEKHLGVY